eukprot:3604609-Pleurochrysis_carterae.AAC.2
MEQLLRLALKSSSNAPKAELDMSVDAVKAEADAVKADSDAVKGSAGDDAAQADDLGADLARVHALNLLRHICQARRRANRARCVL